MRILSNLSNKAPLTRFLIKKLFLKNVQHLFKIASYITIFAITYTSLAPLETVTTKEIYQGLRETQFLDKIIHFISYYFLAFFSFIGHAFFQSRKYAQRVGIFLLFWSACIEIIQQQTGYRDFEFLDLVANFFGIFFALRFFNVLKNQALAC